MSASHRFVMIGCAFGVAAVLSPSVASVGWAQTRTSTLTPSRTPAPTQPSTSVFPSPGPAVQPSFGGVSSRIPMPDFYTNFLSQMNPSYAQPSVGPYSSLYGSPLLNPYGNSLLNPYSSPLLNPYGNPLLNPYASPLLNPYANPYLGNGALNNPYLGLNGGLPNAALGLRTAGLYNGTGSLPFQPLGFGMGLGGFSGFGIQGGF